MNNEKLELVSRLVVDQARLSLAPGQFSEKVVREKLIPVFLDYAEEIYKRSRLQVIQVSDVIDAFFKKIKAADFQDWQIEQKRLDRWGLAL